MRGKLAIQAFWQSTFDKGSAEAMLNGVGKGVLKTKDGQMLNDTQYIVIGNSSLVVR